MTIKQLTDEAILQLEELRGEDRSSAAREFSLAITALEDAQMRASRGLAILHGVLEHPGHPYPGHAPKDLQA